MGESPGPGNRSRRSVLVGSFGSIALSTAGCIAEITTPGEPETDGISAVAGSFFVLYDFVRNITNDELKVTDLVPVGAHGDEWEPPPGIMQEASEADVFVYVSGFRTWSDTVADNLRQDHPEVIVIDVARDIEFIPGESGRMKDPHFWLDPLKSIIAVEKIVEGFITADPDYAEFYEENRKSYVEKLKSVNQEFSDVMETRSRDTIVLGSHNSFQYWEPRYGVSIYSPIGISPDADPPPGTLQEIHQIINKNQIEYILYDKFESTRLAKSIAEETNTELLPLSPIEATRKEHLEKGWGYVEHMRKINLESLARALGANL